MTYIDYQRENEFNNNHVIFVRTQNIFKVTIVHTAHRIELFNVYR
jgi:hypothetical protein